MTASDGQLRQYDTTDAEFEHRLDDWRSGGPELTDAEAERYLAQMDPELSAVEDYLRNEMSPADEAAFTARLATDAAFREKMWPSLAIDRALQTLATPDKRDKPVRRIPWFVAALAAAGIIYTACLAEKLASRAGTYREVRDELRGGLAWTGDMPFFFHRSATGPTETTSLDLPQANVTLRPASRMRWRMEKHTMVAALDGSVLFAMASDTVRVRTAVAQIQATKGYFDVTSPGGVGETLVRVYDGYVDVAPVGSILGTRVTAFHSMRLSRDHPMVADSISPASVPALDILTRIRGYRK